MDDDAWLELHPEERGYEAELHCRLRLVFAQAYERTLHADQNPTRALRSACDRFLVDLQDTLDSIELAIAAGDEVAAYTINGLSQLGQMEAKDAASIFREAGESLPIHEQADIKVADDFDWGKHLDETRKQREE